MNKKVLSIVTAVVMVAIAATILLYVFTKSPMAVDKGDLEKSDILFNNLVSDINTFDTQAKYYSIEKEDYNSVFLNKNHWAIYKKNVKVKNDFSKDIVIDKFDYIKSTDNSYYIKGSDGSQTGLKPGMSEDLELRILIDTDKIKPNQIGEILDSADVKIAYFTVEDIYGDYPENPEYKYFSLKDTE